MSAEGGMSTQESTVLANVQSILALRSMMGEPVLSAPIVRAIQQVQEALAKANESWKKVDWRSNGSSSSRAPHHKPYRPTNSYASASASASGGAGSAAASVSSSTSCSSSAPVMASFRPMLSGPPVKYTSRFKSSEKADDAVLLLIQDKLNKFSPRNYEETHGFLCQILDAGKTHFLKDFMKFVFKKATREEKICPSYAQLLCELAAKYKILLAEMTARYSEFSALFDDISEVELAPDDYKALLENNSDKAYRLGYAQFLGELCKYSVLDTELFMRTIESIVAKIPLIAIKADCKKLLEEYCECLLRILRAVESERSSVATALRTAIKMRFASALDPYTVKGASATYASLSPKGRCFILDITDLVRKF